MVFLLLLLLFSFTTRPASLNQSGTTSAPRESRVMQATVVAAAGPAPKYIPTSSFYINKRIGEALELDPQHHAAHSPHRPRPPVGKVIASTGAGGLYGDNQLAAGAGHGATFTPMRQTFGGASPTELLASPREVSETDLYLLGAIEKLVYRVDYMENRLRRAEQIIYFLMAGNSQKQGKWLLGEGDISAQFSPLSSFSPPAQNRVRRTLRKCTIGAITSISSVG